MSSANVATTDTRRRGTTGCLVCRLREKRCVRLPGSPACSDCNRFRVQCHGHVGSIPSEMKRHYYCQAAREEIREVINDVEPRATLHPLPATQRFSNLLEQARRLSLVNDLATQHQEVSSQFQIRQQSDAFTLAASGVSSSATMESTPAESILQFDPLLFDPSSVHPIHDSVNLVDGAPDRVVYLSPTGSEGPSHHSRPSTLPAHPEPDGTPQDIHVVIESLRLFLRYCGYELVRIR
ncbi:uncharacterized protein EI90DRAFT_3126077 [Cantharellus anzutake]|uniref:uncharacterized protein n=1 Tax=Cantharellus anzutake TaxID=1750568 RepID=UPI001904A684|nr:uncharacterized protein EI90DRAFT_3126077 [Cantharellus anzutake]KAF8328333.1 hypothetical protein EI90DRAFT_3126077 [Cantharellus anzutake]